MQATCYALVSSFLADRGHGQGHVEREARPDEGGSSPGSWILVVSLGLYGAGSLGPAFRVGEAEQMPVPGGTPGKEAALFRVEAVEKGAALEEGEVAGIGQQFQQLVEDMEDVEVVVKEEPEPVSSEEQEGKLGEQGQESPRPGALSDWPPVEALAALQVELDPVNKKAQRTHSRLKDKNCQRRKLHLEHRSPIIQGIRGFWVKVVSLVWCLWNLFYLGCCECSLQIWQFWYKMYVMGDG